MDKKSLVTIVVVALILTTLALPSTALAGNVFTFSGPSAEAFFSSTDPSGCIVTDVFVFASENTIQNPPSPGDSSPGASLFISQYDTCMGTPLLAADGFSSLADGDFQVDRNLNSATLQATVNVHDSVSDSVFDALVDLTWTGSGPLIRHNGSFHFQSPGCTIDGQFTGRFRPAVASGSVSDGQTNFTPDASLAAGIQLAESGEVDVGCGF